VWFAGVEVAIPLFKLSARRRGATLSHARLQLQFSSGVWSRD